MSAADENLDEESWDIRETYALFGRAIYAASCLEVGLAHALMFCEFMAQAYQKIAATKLFNRKQHEAAFDAFMANQFAQTMGNIIKRVNALSEFNDDLKKRIVAAKERRNFLAHHYWRERSLDFMTAKGRAEMQKELWKDGDDFMQLDRDIDAATKATREKLGATDERLNAYSEKMLANIKAGLPWEE
jgi:hypothetical protein